MNFVKTEPGADPIVVEVEFPVEPSSVFRAWTDPDQIRAWFGSPAGSLAAAAVDLRVGGNWRFTERSGDEGPVGFEGRYLEIEPDRRLVFSWSKFSHMADGRRNATPPSRVEIVFTGHGGLTHMKIIHASLDDETRVGFSVGWEAGTANLARHLAAIEP